MKALKKLSCVLLAILLLLSLSVTAFASEGGPVVSEPDATFTLEIKETDAGHLYTAYQIFSGTLTSTTTDSEPPVTTEVLTNITWGNGISSDGIDALCAKYGIDSSDAHAAAKVAEKIGTTAAAAKELADFLATGGADGKTYIAAGTQLKQAEGGFYSESVSVGYYLVLDQATDDAGEVTDFFVSDYIVQVVGKTSMDPKGSVPSVEKKVQDKNDSTGETSGWQDSADYDIGDMVPFQLTATLPDNYDDYDSYKLVFHDKGTNLGDPESVKYFVNDVETAPAEGVTVENDPSDEDTFDITIVDVKKAFPSAKAGDKIVVTYEAELLGTANFGTTGNPNEVVLEYSNNPNGEGTGHTPKDTVIVFTFEFDVNKVRPPEEGEEGNQPLAGAEFTLYKWLPDGEAEGGYSWQAIKSAVTGDGEGANEFKFKGLDDGRYKIEESKTPAGFNTIDPIYFEVKADHDGESANPQLTDLTVTQTDETGTAIEKDKATFTPSVNLEGGTFSADIVNQSGLELPETGGIGTTIFYTVGGILVVAALVLLITKKRMSKEA